MTVLNRQSSRFVPGANGSVLSITASALPSGASRAHVSCTGRSAVLTVRVVPSVRLQASTHPRSFAARSCVPSAENATELAQAPICRMHLDPRQPAEDGPVRSTPRIPEPDRAVTAGGRQRAAVGCERHAPDSTRMSQERNLTEIASRGPRSEARPGRRPRRGCGHRERTPGCK